MQRGLAAGSHCRTMNPTTSASGNLNIELAMTIILNFIKKALNSIEILRDIAVKETTPELLKRFGLPTTMPQAP